MKKEHQHKAKSSNLLGGLVLNWPGCVYLIWQHMPACARACVCV
jgi:hypothetical protein